MELRHKFAILALIYVLSLSANLVMSAWCILVYFRSAFGEYQAVVTRQDDIEQTRALFRRQLALLDGAAAGENSANESRSIRNEIKSHLADLEKQHAAPVADGQLVADWARIHVLASKADAVADRCLDSGRSPSEAGRATFEELDKLLAAVAVAHSRRRQLSVEKAAATQRRVVTILIVNAAAGLVLCIAGLVFVRRWVLRPVAKLRVATKEISRGNFEHRIRPVSRDELGKLAREVDQMAATIVSMQAELVDKERLAAAGEMVTRLAHNIRNPLAGVRGLAEATVQSRPDDEEIGSYQQRIINTLDQFESWLRRLQQSVSPMELNLESVSIRELVENVATALRPMAARRQVALNVAVDADIERVCVDISHFEQALVALITNAIQASGEGSAVRVSVSPEPENAGHWRIEVRDEGAGIAPELREKIFLPYFTTKPDGGGVGLPTAQKVVRAHNGKLTVESELGRGSCFITIMPGLAAEE